ncbi:hypothetical protein Glove_350g131 [Diversispora epigaea]|uniref:Uncharacterized protein n=1 Tax=Diversispora epigaea TaxID=1348612 RepID=A0A397HKI3_9GLOM|nr:hypothetical protein Glove_350g131 [Diversispora epigaea]
MAIKNFLMEKIKVELEDPRLWSNCAQTYIKINGKHVDADLVLLCKSGWRKAEELARNEEYRLAARELERLSRIVNRRPVKGVDWNTWERERNRYSEKHYQDMMLLKSMSLD